MENKPKNKRKTTICRVCYKKYYIEGKIPKNFVCHRCFVKSL